MDFLAASLNKYGSQNNAKGKNDQGVSKFIPQIQQPQPQEQQQYANVPSSYEPSIAVNDSEIEEDTLKGELPSLYAIERIFKDMSVFDIMKRKTPNLDYTADDDDRLLSDNIQLIFKEETAWNTTDLLALLKRIVENEDILMKESRKKIIRRTKDKSLNASEKKMIFLFYPNLLSLMLAVYYHCKHYYKMMVVKTDVRSVIKQQIMSTWTDVFNELTLICNVIVYANKKEKGDNTEDEGFLKDLPQNWNDFIKQKQKTYNKLVTRKLKLEESNLALKGSLVKMEMELNNIKTSYEREDMKYKQSVTEIDNLNQTIHGLVNVSLITKENKDRLITFRDKA